MARTRRGWGTVRRRASGRWQAFYTGPDLAKHYAPTTYDTREDAEAWLTDERRRLSAGAWTPPSDRAKAAQAPDTFARYSAAWLADRDLKPRTREHYRQLLDHHLLPMFGSLTLAQITPAAVRSWHAGMGRDRPTTRAHAYGLLRTILSTAVQDGEIPANPAHIRGAGSAPRAKQIEIATPEQLAVIIAHMPPRYRSMVLLSVFCHLRFGEAAELRRKDVDLAAGIVSVDRAVVRVGGVPEVTTPKSAAGQRKVHIPADVLPVLRDHIESLPMRGRDTLLWPAADGVSHLNPTTLYRSWYPAREAAGRPDLRWHDLRHTGLTWAAHDGATQAESMRRGGHSTGAASLRYQHATDERDAQIAEALGRRFARIAQGK